MFFRVPVNVIGFIVRPLFNVSIPNPAASKDETIKLSVVLLSTGFFKVLSVKLMVLPAFKKV